MWLITSDLHLNSNARDAYRFQFLEWLLKLAIKRKASALIINGDITDEKDRHPAWLVNEIADRIERFAEILGVSINKGNHDYKDEDEPFFQFLDLIRQIKFYSSPTIASSTGKTLFLPHTRNYKKEWAKYLPSKFKNYKYVFAHQTFQGADVGARKLDGIPLSIFDPSVKVFCGDVHIPQKTGPVTYIGAPYTVDFGDSYQGRVILLDPDTGKTESIPYDGPQKRVVDTHGGMGSVVVGMIRKGDIVKVRANLTTDEYDGWKEVRSNLREWIEKQGAVAHSIQPIVETKRKKVNYKKIDPESDLQIVKAFVKRVGASQATLDVGLNILKET